MKRVFLLCNLLMVTLTLAAQSRYVMVEGMVNTPDGMVYNLPASTLAVDLVVEKEQITAGPYARYALKCLGLRVPFADKTTWSLVGADVALADDQRLTAPELADPEVSINPLQTGEFEALSIDRLDMVQTTDEEAAMAAAKQIFQLRRSRMDLITGEAGEHVFGEGLATALEAMEAREKALMELFVGKRVVIRETRRQYVNLTKDKHMYILCRFNEQSGILPSTDLSGQIVLLEISVGAPYEVESAAEKSGQVVECRVAAPSTCSVQLNGTELGSRTLPLFVFGEKVLIAKPRS